MRNRSDHQTPVGVVPRREAQSIAPLVSDTPAGGTVVDAAADPGAAAAPAWIQWLPSVTAVAAVAGALDWLKLPR